MRSIIAAVTLLASSAYALSNADFNPSNFVDEQVPTLTLNETFTTFRWKGDEAYARESFDVVNDVAMRIQVIDYKNRGDMFEVFDNGKSLGKTTQVDDVKDDDLFAATPEEALLDERFSQGIFDLAAGEHKITIKAAGPYEAGTAAIRMLDHSNNAFYKKKHDDDDDDDDKHWHKGGDDDDDEDDDDDKHWHKGGDDDKDDDDKHWHKGGDDDKDDDDKHWHKGGDDDKDDDDKHWHKGGDDDKDDDDKHWHKGGDDDKDDDDKHWHKGGDDDKDDDKHGHKGGDYDEENKKWQNKKPTSEEIDFDHTITFTRTKWVVAQPTDIARGGHGIGEHGGRGEGEHGGRGEGEHGGRGEGEHGGREGDKKKGGKFYKGGYRKYDDDDKDCEYEE